MAAVAVGAVRDAPVASGQAGAGEAPAEAQSQPADPRARLLLCRQKLEAGETDEAYALAESVVEVPREDRGLYLLAEVLLRLGEPLEARRECLGALSTRESPFGRCLLGRIHVAEGLFALALEQFERAASLGYSKPEMHFGLAEAYAGLGNYLGELQPVTAEGDAAGNVGTLVNDLLIVESAGDEPGTYLAATAQSAIYQVKVAQRLGMATFESKLLEASIWQRANYFTRAVEIYEELATRIEDSGFSDSRRAEFYEAYSRALFGADDLGGSVDAIKRAARLDAGRFGPKLVEAYDRAANRCVQRGDLNGYIHYLELALAEAPDSVDFHYRIGFAYFESGRKRDAAREWQITLQLDPQHLDRERLLELIQDVVSGR